jgi:hypothetical protein
VAGRIQKPVLPHEEEIQIAKRLGIRRLPVVGLAGLGLVSSGLIDSFPPLIRFLVVAAIFLWIPGELLRRRVLPHAPVELRYPLALLGGISVWAVVTWGCWILGASFTAYLAALEMLSAAIFVLSLFRRGKLRPIESVAAIGAEKTASRFGIALFAPALCVAVFFIVFPPRISQRGDALVHIGMFRSIITENALLPDDALAPPVGSARDAVKTDPRVGATHPLFAAFAELSGAEPVAVWRWIPVVLAPAAFLAFAGFAAALLPGRIHAVFAILLFLLFQGGIGREFLGAIGYGQHLSVLFMWLFIVLALRYAREESPKILFAIGLLVVGGALVHVDAIVHYILAFVAFALFYRVFGFTVAGVVAVGAVVAAGAGTVAAWRFVETYQTGNVLHSHAQGLLYFLDTGDRFFVLSPAEIVRKNGILFFTSLFLVPLLLFRGRHRRFALMSLALSVPPLVTVLNPLVCPALYASVHYLAHRFVLNVPGFVVTSLVLGSAVSWGRRGSLLRRAVAGIFLATWGCVFLVAARAWVSDLGAVGRFGGGRVYSREVGDAFHFINERIPAGSVVASDAVTSHMIGAFTGADVVAVLGQHGNPSDPRPIERLSALYAIMSPFTSQIEAIAAIRRFGVDYVMVNGAFDAPYHEFFADWDPQFFSILERKYGSLDEVFERVYRSEHVLIYRVGVASIGRTTWEPGVPYLEVLQEDLEPCPAGESGMRVEVAGMSISPQVAVPGEAVRLSLAYRRQAGSISAWPLALRLRFENKAYFDRSRRFPGDKHVRRFRERREGAFQRFRMDRKPFDGYFPAHRWPDVGFCYETFEVHLPVALDESVYEVQWQLVEETLLPNFSLRDFLFNDDSFEGTPCVELDVRREVVR